MNAEQVQARLQRFQKPKGGGRAADRAAKTRRLVRMSQGTLERLSRLARHFSRPGRTIGPMQVAAVLIEMAVEEETQKRKART